MDLDKYLQNGQFHFGLVKEFLREATLDWRGVNLDFVLDVGCGPGNASTKCVKCFLPNIQRLVGIDCDPLMITYAKQTQTDDKVEFYVADIMDKSSLKSWQGQVSGIVSTFALHRVKDQMQAFRNIFDLLKPSGEAALIFVMISDIYLAISDLLNTNKWNEIIKESDMIFPDSFHKKCNASHFKQMFEDAGFDVNLCESKSLIYTHETDSECIEFLLSVYPLKNVSDDIEADYKKDLFEQLMKYSIRDNQERVCHNVTSLLARVSKKQLN